MIFLAKKCEIDHFVHTSYKTGPCDKISTYCKLLWDKYKGEEYVCHAPMPQAPSFEMPWG